MTRRCRATRLTPSQVATAREMHFRHGVSWRAIAERFGCDHETVRRLAEPGFAERRARQIAEAKSRRKYGADRYRGPKPQEINPLYDPRRDGEPVWANPFDRIFGDPPIGRRAIDQRARA